MIDKQPDPRDIANEIERLKESLLFFAQGSQEMADGMKEVMNIMASLEARITVLEQNWAGEAFSSQVLK